MRRTLAALLLRGAGFVGRGAGAPSIAAAGAAALPLTAHAGSIASRAAPASLLTTVRGLAASTSGRAHGSSAGVVAGAPLAVRGVATASTPAAAAVDGGAAPTSASNHAIAALKARLMPVTGRNQFRRKWKKQAEIKANHRRRLHQEALATARRLKERKARWAAAAARAGAGDRVGVEGAPAGDV